MRTSTITTKGQITIPADFRKAMNLKQGDVVEFKLQKGQLIVQPKENDITKIFGLVKSNKKVSLDDMDNAITENRAKKCKE